MKTISPAARFRYVTAIGQWRQSFVLSHFTEFLLAEEKWVKAKLKCSGEHVQRQLKRTCPLKRCHFFFLIGSKILVNVCGGEAKNIKYFIWVIFRLFFKNKQIKRLIC